MAESPTPTGYESYSHWLRMPRPTTADSSKDATVATSSRAQGQEYLLRLDGPLSSPEVVRTIAALPTLPPTYNGSSDTGDSSASFCRIDAQTKQIVLPWLALHRASHRPLFIAQSLATKNFDAHSVAPMLGCDATLPQY